MSKDGSGRKANLRSLATFTKDCDVDLLMGGEKVGRAKLLSPTEETGGGIFQRTMHGHSLAASCKSRQDLVVVRNVVIVDAAKHLKYPYSYGGLESPPDLLMGLHQGIHSWDRYSMVPSSCDSHLTRKKTRQSHSPYNVQLRRRARKRTLNDGNAQGNDGGEVGAPQSDLPAQEELSTVQVQQREEVSGHEKAESEQGSQNATPPNESTRDLSGSNGHSPSNQPAVSASEQSSMDESETNKTESKSALSPLQKRKYTFVERNQREKPEEAELHKKRRLISKTFTAENIKNMSCCTRMNCFRRTDKAYLRAQVARILRMTQDERRAVLEGMLDASIQAFLFNGVRVCSSFLEQAFGFSRYLQARVKGTPASIRRKQENFGNEQSRISSLRDAVICYLERLAESTGDRMPDSEEHHLPFFQKDQVYIDFCKEFEVLNYASDGVSAHKKGPPSSSYFYSVWNQYCSHLKVRKNHRFTKCGDCERLRAALEEKRTDAKATSALREKKRNHNDMVTRERREYAKKCQKAILYPNDYCSIIVDGADQSAFGLPHFRVKVKEARGHAIGVKLIGVLEHGPAKKITLLLMTEQYETGANHIIVAIHRHLTMRNLSSKLPSTLFVQADNCIRENKNQFFFGYLECLVAWGVFCEVYVSFLPIGHTHSDIDQVFSRTSTRLSHQDAVTLEELMDQLSKSYTSQPQVVHMKGIINFSGLCKKMNCLSSSRGFTAYRYDVSFRFAGKETDSPNERFFDTTCFVRMSCDDDWEPLRSKADEGFLKSIPDLRLTPPTPVTSPTNFREVSKRLETEQSRIKASRMDALRKLRDDVYKTGEEPFHGNLANTIEMNGRFSKILQGTESGDESTEEARLEPQMDLSYDLNDFVAVRVNRRTEELPFWIARIQEVEKNEDGVVYKLRVLWYELYRGNSAYKGKYRPSQKPTGKGKSSKLWFDTISVNTVVHTFSSLTSTKEIPVTHQKSIWQSLN